MRWTPRRTTRTASSGTSAVAVIEAPTTGTGTGPGPAPGVEPEEPLPPDVPVGCRVVLVGSFGWGSAGTLRGLTDDLPSSWSVTEVDEIGDITVADLVVLTQPTSGKVASVLARQPDASVVALAHPTARVDLVVELLQAGATACVRSGDPGLVAAHLVACSRRYRV